MAGELIGKVQSIQGVVEVRGANGKIRLLLVGDELHQGDVVLTGGGGHVVIQLADGGAVTIDPGHTVAMTAELSASHFPGSDEAQVANADQLAQSILNGADLNNLLEATAAGPAGGGAANEGHSFVQLLRIVESADAGLGVTTAGLDNGGPAQFDRITPLVQEAPAPQPPVATPDGNDNDPVTEAGQNADGTTKIPGDATADGNVLPNDLDPDSPQLTVIAVNDDPTNVGAVVSGTYGTVTIGADGTYHYQLNDQDPDTQLLAQGDSAQDVFTYTVSDGNGGTSSTTLTITITGTNDVPVVTNDAVSVTEDVNVVGGLLSTSGAVTIADLDHDQSSFNTGSLTFAGRVNSDATDTGTSPLGTLTVNSDGTYSFSVSNAAVQYLGADDSIVQTYTVQSVDGTATSTITITIYGTNDGPTVVVDSGNPGGANDVVYEAGLPDGSGVGPTTTTATGTITLSDPDGLSDIKTVTINGTAIAIGSLEGSHVDGTNGTLTITAYDAATGVAQYTYTLTSPATDGAGTENDTFTVSTSDGTVSSDPATITIEIADDVPVARNDADSVTEDGPLVANGNVITGSGGNDANTTDGVADTLGADGLGSIAWTGASGSTVAGSYGTLTVDANGNYSYALNNGLAAVQHLDAGQTLTETFTYTLTDGDGDARTATLTVTINGANDTPTITTDSGNPDGANDIVYEAGLPDGSGVGDTTTTATGTFTVSDPDGIGDIKTVTINGTTFAIGDLAGSHVDGPNGTLTITAYNAATGVATYSYALTSPATDGAGTENNTFTVTTSDGTTSSDPAAIVIEIADDVPVARNDADSVTEDGPLVANGNVITGSGGDDANSTDGVADTLGADGLGSIAWTGASQGAVAGSYGTLTVGADGSYSYAVDNASAAVQHLDAGQTLTETFTYTLTDGDGDARTATLTITINGANDGPTVVVDSGNPGGANDIVYEAGLPAGSGVGPTTTTATGTITLADADGLDDLQSVTINGNTIAIGDLVGSHVDGPNGTLTITAYNAATGVATYSYALTSPATDGAGTESNTFTVSTSDGTVSSDPATITIEIADDVPVARNDADSVTEDGPLVANGNVITGSGGNDANTTDGVADTLGADGLGSIAWTGASGSTVAGSYGTLTVGADGSYSYALNNGLAAVQHLDAGQTATETFTYTLTDGDGDARTATLTITINGTNDKPTITTDSGNGGANDIVYEAGLPSGSGVGPTTTTATGTITLADADGLDDLKTVTINGNSIAIGSLVGSHVDGPNGTLTITAYNAATGVATYSYALTSPTTDGAGTESNTFTVSTSDGTVSSDPATITIEIADDVPVARNDADSVTEDGATVADGNVLTGVGGSDANATDGVADTRGADGLGSLVWTGASGSTVAGSYGTLTVDANGNYSYALNNGLAAVQHLDAGQTLTETFTYTLTDGDGDARTATLTVTINGSNDKPTIVTDSGNPGGAHDVVYEAGLPNGTHVGPTTTVVGGTFTLSDPDGLSDIKTVTINGQAIAMAALVGSHVDGPNGTLTITAYDAATGVAQYSYALTSPTTDGAGTESNTFTLTTSDGTVSSDPAQIVIDIVDDVPTLTADNEAIANVAGSYSGNLAFNVGADTLTFAQSFDTANALTWTNPRDGFSFNYDTVTQTGTATFNDGTGTKTFFTVHLNSDGTYDFNLVTPDPVTVVTIDSLLAGISGGSNLSSYTIPSSNFDGEFALKLTGFTDNGATASTITISNTALGVGDNVMHGNKDDVLRFDVVPVNGSDSTVSSLTIHVDGTSGWKATDSVTATLHYSDGTTGTQTLVWGADQSVTFVTDASKTIDYLDLTPVGTAAFKIDGVSMSYTTSSFPDDYHLDFSLTGHDSDGDMATDQFQVNVDTTDTSTYTVTGSSGVDTVYGTAGNDILTGGGGADTFVFRLADVGTSVTPAADKITDFGTGGNDALDLRDILPTVGDSNAAELSNYLHFNVSGGTTTVSVSTTSGGPTVQTIELTGVDLSNAGALGSDQAIIQNLLDTSRLLKD